MMIDYMSVKIYDRLKELISDNEFTKVNLFHDSLFRQYFLNFPESELAFELATKKISEEGYLCEVFQYPNEFGPILEITKL